MKKYEYTPEMIRTIKRCKKDLVYFTETFIRIKSIDKDTLPCELYPAQVRVLKSLMKKKYVMNISARQSGKTTLEIAFILWSAMFSTNNVIALVGMNHDAVTSILKRILFAFDELPDYLKVGLVSISKDRLAFSNGSYIIVCSSNSIYSLRGMTINTLVVDEAGFVNNPDLWIILMPVLLCHLKSKMFIVGTQNGKTHPDGSTKMFYKLYQQAQKDTKNWKIEKTKWWQVFDRDMAWKKSMVNMLGSKDIFRKEFRTDFID